MNLRILLALTALVVSAADGYHILCIFTIPSRSHNHLGQGIVRALLNAGHEVTWVTPYPPKEVQNGLHIIDGSATRALSDAIDMSDQRNANAGISFVKQFSANVSTVTANIPALREAVVRGGYHAVATEVFFSDVQAGYAAILQVPWILLSGVSLQPNVEAIIDEVRSVPIIPLLFNDFGIPMTFFERVVNVAMHNVISFSSWWEKPKTEQHYHTLFASLATARGVPLPPLEEALNNVSVLFLNSHSSFAPAQSLPPNAIEIAGYHIEETVAPLPKDMQELLDSSPQGVIYFSMGSVVKSSALPPATKQALLKTLGELPYTVLWKFEEELKGLPKNVHISSWMPQAAILAHKNTKVFITHGGLLSNLETLRYGVPLVAIPVFGDQPSNAAKAVRSGYAVRVTFDDNMAEGLRDALKEVLGTDKYYKRVKYLSALFNKRPVAPSKLIPHYIEVAIETNGAYHLRSKATLYAWYQRSMLDILAVVLISLYISYRVLKKIVKTIVSKVKGSSSSAVSKKIKKRS